jgi:hypothetical protein
LETIRSLSLQMRYEDGFVAYLNGIEVARRNAPAVTGFASVALSNRRLRDANQFEEINISQFRGALRQGENVLALHGLNDSANSAEFVLEVRLTGVDIPASVQFGYAAEPTPGATNGTLYSGFVADVSFSRGRGLYDAPQTLQLATPGTADARIYITRDGSHPTPDNPRAELYERPILIDRTVVLRAAGYREDLLPSPAVTHSYILPRDVIDQPRMHPAVTRDPLWGPQMVESLRALPSISLVTEQAIDVTSEIETSVEMIFPDGTAGFQIDAGVEVYGGTAVALPKQSLRLSFKNEYGPSMLEFDVFADPDGVHQFDQLLLRAGSQDSLFWNGAAGGSAYVRNLWAAQRQREMGQLAPRGRFVQLYINGQSG